MTLMSKPGKRGLPRLLDSFLYSLLGLKAAWRNEEAFRLEVCLALIFVPMSFWLGQSLEHQLLLLLSCGIVLLAELVNSAIEAVVDRVGPEQHPLSAQAKDIGSAVVFISLNLFLLIWGYSAWARFGPG